MEKKGFFLILLLIFLGLSYVLSSINAIPLSRSLVLVDHEDPSLQEVPEEEELIAKQEENFVEMLDEDGELIVHGRMVAQSNDYPGTGANNHHDPKPPGKV